MGAPTKDIKRDIIKTIRMTPEEWEVIQLAADQAGLRPTTYMNQCIVTQAKLHVNFTGSEQQLKVLKVR